MQFNSIASCKEKIQGRQLLVVALLCSAISEKNDKLMMSAILLDKLQNYRLVKLHEIPLDLNLLSHIKEAVLTAMFVSPGIL